MRPRWGRGASGRRSAGSACSWSWHLTFARVTEKKWTRGAELAPDVRAPRALAWSLLEPSSSGRKTEARRTETRKKGQREVEEDGRNRRTEVAFRVLFVSLTRRPVLPKTSAFGLLLARGDPRARSDTGCVCGHVPEVERLSKGPRSPRRAHEKEAGDREKGEAVEVARSGG